ncbi:MAG: hypothetical protein AAFX10_17245 [Pseudomonadota bacterium]
MDGVTELQVGQHYFYAMFYDDELSVPSIETFVYIGRDEDGSFAFQDAESYLAHQRSEDDVQGALFAFPEGKLDGIVDKRRLIQWLVEDHSPTKVGRSYKYVEIE